MRNGNIREGREKGDIGEDRICQGGERMLGRGKMSGRKRIPRDKGYHVWNGRVGDVEARMFGKRRQTWRSVND